MAFADTQPVNLRGSKIVLMVEGFFLGTLCMHLCCSAEVFQKSVSLMYLFLCAQFHLGCF